MGRHHLDIAGLAPGAQVWVSNGKQSYSCFAEQSGTARVPKPPTGAGGAFTLRARAAGWLPCEYTVGIDATHLHVQMVEDRVYFTEVVVDQTETSTPTTPVMTRFFYPTPFPETPLAAKPSNGGTDT